MKIASVLCILVLQAFAFAQPFSSGSIAGTLADETTRRPLEFVNVVLLRSPDSTIVTGSVSDKLGRFELTSVPFGNYRIQFRLLGYTERVSRPLTLSAERERIDVGTILLAETTVNLDEVLITSQRSLVNSSIDRKVFNVSQDVMSKAGSVSELLQNIPSIEVDIDGNGG
jgi:hypothetical protein